MTEHAAHPHSEPSAAPPEPRIHEFTVAGPIDATVHNPCGAVTLRAEHGTAVRVELHPRGPAGQELLERMRVHCAEGRLRIEDPDGSGHEFGTGFGDLFTNPGRATGGSSWTDRLASVLRSATGGTRIRSGGLDITVLVPAGSRAEIKDGVGEVRLHGDFARLEARTGAGGIVLDRGAELSTRVTTGAGDITVGPGGAEVSVNTGAGDVVLARSEGDVAVRTGAGDVLVRTAVSGRLSIRSGLGDVTVRVAEGTATHVDLATAFGERDVRLTPADGAHAAERTLEITARSGKGDLRVLRADPASAAP